MSRKIISTFEEYLQKNMYSKEVSLFIRAKPFTLGADMVEEKYLKTTGGYTCESATCDSAMLILSHVYIILAGKLIRNICCCAFSIFRSANDL